MDIRPKPLIRDVYFESIQKVIITLRLERTTMMNEKRSMSELGRIKPHDFRKSNKQRITLVLDNIRSGLNVGSIFRSADAFRIEKIICCGFTPVPPHREVLKSALGATETVAWEYAAETMDAVNELKNNDCHCFAIEQTAASEDLYGFEVDAGKSIALVLGNEVSGVKQKVIDLCEGSIEISQYGTKHSLNVAVCAGIVLFDLSNKLSGTKK